MSKAAAWLRDNFGKAELLARSPGRINLIGEHVDYTGGHMMPAAIQLGIDMAVRKNGLKEVRLYSLNFANGASIDLANLDEENRAKGWTLYPLGVLKEWKARGLPMIGFDVCFYADLPNGAGLSSSAALTCGLAFVLNQLLATSCSLMDLAAIARDAERKHVGVQCGWMDQVAVLFSEPAKWLHFDVYQMKVEKLSIPSPPPVFMLMDTGVKHSLASSAYNQRVSECEAIMNLLRDHFPFFQHIREFNTASLPELEQLLPQFLFSRAKHIISENERVSQVMGLFRKASPNAWAEIGKALLEGHASLSSDYEVSCAETDFLVDQCKEIEECYGARMVGGGFGGAVLALLQPDYPEEEVQALKIGYEKRFYKSLQFHQVRPSAGCRLL
jgi:galactokinase